MKRILALMLVLAMVAVLLPMPASAAQGGKLVAITFDDGPDSYDTPRLLDGLKRRGVHVTFFVQGAAAAYQTDLVRRAYDEGHEIASHTWNHPQLTAIPLVEVASQIERTEAVLDTVCGEGTEYLVRPPYGSTNPQVCNVIDCPLILWSADTLDWELLNSYAVRDAILQKAFDGGIVLLHDIHSTSVDGALMAIDVLLDWGYELVTVSELYRRRGVELEGHEKYYMEPPNGYEDPGPIPTPEITYTTDGVTVEVTITADTDAPVYYTTDGTGPKNGSREYTGPFTVPYPCDIRAVAAYKLNGSRSETAVLSFGGSPCEAPTIRVEDMVMTITHPEDVNFFYTINGGPADTEGTLYTGPVELPGACDIRVIAAGGSFTASREVKLFASERSVLYAPKGTREDWFDDSMDRLAAMGIISGVEPYNYDPQGMVSRGMLVELIRRCCGGDLGETWEKTNSFQDVGTKAYYAEAVEWAFRNGVAGGYSQWAFRPEENVTRGELLQMVERFLADQGLPLEQGESQVLFSKYNQDGDWLMPAWVSVTSAGLGYGSRMNPQCQVTRAEVADVLVRMLDYQNARLGDQ